jgi:hypothetical protein
MTSTIAPSSESIRSGFVFTSLDPIVGEPTYRTLDLAHTQCIRNATTITSRLGGGGHGHAGLVEFPDVYLLRTAHHFNRPIYPGEAPAYPIGATDQERDDILLLWQQHTKAYNTCQRVEQILLSMLENAVEDTYLTGIHDPAHGFGARSIIDVFQYLFRTYGQIGPDEILANQHKLTQPVDPHQPMAILFKQIEDCQKFAAAGQVAITPQQVLKAAETLILQTGKYVSAYREWIALDPAHKTYHNFKIRMNQEYQLQNTMTTTARDAGYHHANAAITPNDEESLASAAHEFAAASASDRAAFEQLTSTNGVLNEQLANMAIQNQQIQHQMQQLQQHVMYMATAAPPPPQHQPRRPAYGQGGRGGRSRHRQHRHPPTQMHYQPPVPPPGFPPASAPPTGTGGYPSAYQQYRQPALPPPPPAMPHYGQTPGPPPYQAPFMPSTWPPMQQHAPARHPNAKRYNNMNYCWTHGFDVSDQHTGMSCQRPAAPYHQPQATRQNPMGGSQKDVNKIIMGP